MVIYWKIQDSIQMKLTCLPHDFVPVLAEADRDSQGQIEILSKHTHNFVWWRENGGWMNKLPQLLRVAGSIAFFSITGSPLWGVHFHINPTLTRQGKTVLTVIKGGSWPAQKDWNSVPLGHRQMVITRQYLFINTLGPVNWAWIYRGMELISKIKLSHDL